MKIANRIKLNFVFLSLVSVILTGLIIVVVVVSLTSNIVEDLKRKELENFRDVKASEIEHYFKETNDEILVFSKNLLIKKAMEAFSAAFKLVEKKAGEAELILYNKNIKNYINDFLQEYYRINDGENLNPKKLLQVIDYKAFYMQYKYIFENPNKFTEKASMFMVKDDSEYGKVHKKYHYSIKNIQEKLQFSNIFLVNNDGRIVYSVNKDISFGTSLKNSFLNNSPFKKIFEDNLESRSRNFTSISDFSSYIPAFGSKEAFIGTSIFNDHGEKIGILIFQISGKFIDKIMTNNYKWQEIGLGNTGEIFLIGPNFEFKSINRFAFENLPKYLLNLKKLGASEEEILSVKNKKTNVGIKIKNAENLISTFKKAESFGSYKNYRDALVLSAYKPLNIKGLNWIIVAEIQKKEAYSLLYKLVYQIIFISILIAIIVCIIAWFIGIFLTKIIMGPIKRYSNVITNIADKKDLTKRITVQRKDELGNMAIALNKLFDSFERSCLTTLESSKKMLQTASKLKEIATVKQEEIELEDKNSDEQKNIRGVQDAEEIKKASKDLGVLYNKLTNISAEFKILEKESKKRSRW